MLCVSFLGGIPIRSGQFSSSRSWNRAFRSVFCARVRVRVRALGKGKGKGKGKGMDMDISMLVEGRLYSTSSFPLPWADRAHGNNLLFLVPHTCE